MSRAASLRPVAAGPLVVGLAACSAVALALIGWVHDEPGSSAWYAATVGLAMVSWRAGRTRVARTALPRLLPAWTTALALATIGTAFVAAATGAPPQRTDVGTGHPNLLAASLAVAGVASLALRAPRVPYAPRTRRAAVSAVAVDVSVAVLVVGALVLTGSRTGVAAFLIGSGLIAWWRRDATVVRRSLVAGALIVAAAWGGLHLVLHQERTARNLLHQSGDVTRTPWRTSPDAAVRFTPGDGERDGVPDDATRISGRLADDRLVLLHGRLGRSEAGAAYVASVYVRADAPTRVDLTTNLSRVSCAVETTWSRCVTPPGIGDGTTYVQFRMLAPHTTSRIDLRVAAPQLERGSNASAYVPKGATLLPRPLLERFTVGALLAGDPRRVAVARIALAQGRGSPWVGVGRDGVRRALATAEGAVDVTHLTHAHNLLLERFAAEGALGLVAWALLLVPPTVAAARRHPSSTLALIATLATLNTIDLTFFYTGSFVPTFAALGALSLGRARPTVDDPSAP
ncbi:MAG: O-antigen ligase family protein [Trueperaceae bacterium]|nr:O-antigen ligase family protein [Trueperaceae bacterium]